MRTFIKTVVPTEGYTEVKKVGEHYVVHLDPVNNPDDDSTTCYECITDDEPDISLLSADLEEFKAHMADVELSLAKKEKIKALEAYDKSSAVNSFTITKQGLKVTDYWLPRDLRTSLEGDVLAASAISDTYTFDIREIGISLELNCNKFLAALAVLRRYAYKAFNVTSSHLVAINNLGTVQEVEAYDFTTDYPERLIFSVEELS
jgi:hypothetical protein